MFLAAIKHEKIQNIIMKSIIINEKNIYRFIRILVTKQVLKCSCLSQNKAVQLVKTTKNLARFSNTAIQFGLIRLSCICTRNMFVAQNLPHDVRLAGPTMGTLSTYFQRHKVFKQFIGIFVVNLVNIFITAQLSNHVTYFSFLCCWKFEHATLFLHRAKTLYRL